MKKVNEDLKSGPDCPYCRSKSFILKSYLSELKLIYYWCTKIGHTFSHDTYLKSVIEAVHKL